MTSPVASTRPDSGGTARTLRRCAPLMLVPALVLALLALSLLKPSMHTEGCLETCSFAAERRDGPLRVVSLNMLHGFPRFEHLSQRLDLIAGEIDRLQADIVCLQEVPWTLRLGSGAEYLAKRAGMNYLYLRANGNRRTILFEEGVAILSRYPLSAPATAELEPQAGPFEHRVVLHAVVETPWTPVSVFVTHLTHGDPEVNRRQAASLMAFVDATGSGPAVVTGDLNARADSPQVQSLTQHWEDAYRAANPDGEGLTCCIDNVTAGTSEQLESRIDYVLVAPRGEEHIGVVDARLVLDRPFQVSGGWQWASDHIGLLAEIALGHWTDRRGTGPHSARAAATASAKRPTSPGDLAVMIRPSRSTAMLVKMAPASSSNREPRAAVARLPTRTPARASARGATQMAATTFPAATASWATRWPSGSSLPYPPPPTYTIPA